MEQGQNERVVFFFIFSFSSSSEKSRLTGEAISLELDDFEGLTGNKVGDDADDHGTDDRSPMSIEVGLSF